MTNEYFCCRLNSSTSSSEEEIEMAKATGSKMIVLKRDGRLTFLNPNNVKTNTSHLDQVGDCAL